MRIGFRLGYLRFLNSISPSGVVAMYSNPASISFMVSTGSLVALHVHSSEVVRNSADSMFMYVIVLSMSLCPSTVLTWIMSLVLWYSIVPFQCLNVWNVIFVSRGLLIFSAVLARIFSKVIRSPCFDVVKTLSFSLVSLPSMAFSFSVIGRIRGLLCFSGVMLMVLRSRSMSIHFSIVASPIRAPVSFSSCRSAALFVPDAVISWSISCSVGMKGILSSGLYVGFSHVLPMNFMYPL